MVKKILYLSLLVLLFTSCREEVTLAERDKMLSKAFQAIQSKNEDVVIAGIKTIKKYPTNDGLMKLISLWESDISMKVEKEVLCALSKDEVFRGDSTLIEEIFKRNYSPSISREKKEKLKRLLQRTDVKIRDELINKIDNDTASRRPTGCTIPRSPTKSG